MEQPLLPQEKEKAWRLTWSNFLEELKSVSYMAAPMVAVSFSMYVLQVISMMMVGHLGELSLSGVAVATSITNVTGFSLLFGMSGALETLCGQAYGARQYLKVGTYTYCQDPQISMVACRYAVWLIPALFASAILQPLVRYFLSQGLIVPLLLSSSTTVFLHLPLCWALVYKMELGNIGAALATGLSYWFNVMLLGFIMKYSASCEKTCILVLQEIFSSIKEFFSFALPSAVMICLEWWSFELLILLSGLLPNSKVETSVLSICTRVSNELGAGNPQAARVVVIATVGLTAVEAISASITLFCCRYVFGYAFSSEKEIVNYVTEMAPLISLSIIADSLHSAFSGIARGSGWQHIAACVNLGAYYLVGIPVAILLCFGMHFRGKGLWIGIVAGSTVQSTLLAIVTAFTNWQKQADKVRHRIFKETFPVEKESA
ncbi:hypothetical protein SLEP1_g10764 [Rubroshorea leprosula]|uniref:Protein DETOXIFICATION n=1 Tax=Rubroshorea leprosula TaxID=152421 RepID=A0AAV5IKH8_9ROSI|nr:hypothetical protein SLEP1_g10764 [Rubroshorea leprosula]